MDHEDAPAAVGDKFYEESCTFMLDGVCQDLWGDDWAAPLSAYLGVGLRTCQRVRAAARVRTTHDAARSLVMELRDALAETTLKADADAGSLSRRAPRDPMSRRRAVMSFAKEMFVDPEDGIYQLHEGVAVGPYRAGDLMLVHELAAESENGLAALLSAVIRASNQTDAEEARRIVLKAVDDAAGVLLTAVEVKDNGTLAVIGDGNPTFDLDEYELEREREGDEPHWEIFLDAPREWHAKVAEVLLDFGATSRPARVLAGWGRGPVEGLLICFEVDAVLDRMAALIPRLAKLGAPCFDFVSLIATESEVDRLSVRRGRPRVRGLGS
jgi:hypothetical protein